MTDSGQIIINYGDAPNIPSEGRTSIYVKNDKCLYTKDDTGLETKLTIPSGTIITDHGQLTGLSDDDHTQYHNDTRGDSRYYTKDQADYRHVHDNTGVVSFPYHVYLGSGNIMLPDCTVVLNSSSDGSGTRIDTTVSGTTMFIPEEELMTVVVRYNSGSPIYDLISTSQSTEVDNTSVIMYETLYRKGDNILKVPFYGLTAGTVARLHGAVLQGLGVKRAGNFGFETSISGTNYLNINAGITLAGSQPVQHNNYDSKYNDLHLFYHETSDEWTCTLSGGGVLNNTHYDSGNGLVELSDNYYSNLWVYKVNGLGNEAIYVTNTEEYPTTELALAADFPTDLPDICNYFVSLLVARITIQKGATGGIVTSAFNHKFSGIDSTRHNSLTNIQGGATSEYYHLTQSEYLNIAYGDPTFDTITGEHYGDGSHLTNINHSGLSGLGNDDHLQYFNTTRGDNRYYTKSQADNKYSTIASTLYNKYSATTGLIEGGLISINADGYRIDISAGKALYADFVTDVNNPVVEIIEWSDQTLDPGLTSTKNLKWVGVTKNQSGNAEFLFNETFSATDERTVAIIGRVWTSDPPYIESFGQYSTPAFYMDLAFKDFMDVVGSVNKDGNVFTPNGANLILDKSSGKSFRFSAGSPLASPNIIDNTTLSGINVYHYYYRGSGVESSSEIVPGYYDNDSVKTAIPAGKFSIQRIYFFPVSDYIAVTYGQTYYDTQAEAEQNYLTESYDLDANNTERLSGSIFRAYLIVQSDATDLSDSSQAKLIRAIGYFGGSSSGSSGVGGVTDHGELTGLSDDDHLQYLTLGRGDARYYTQSQVDTISGSITSSIAPQMVATALAAIQVRATSNISLNTSYTAVSFDTIDYAGSVDVIKRDDVYTSRVYVYQDGLYEIGYEAKGQTTSTTDYVYAKIVKNGSSDISGSYTFIDIYAGEIHEIENVSLAELAAGDYVELQLSRGSASASSALASTKLKIEKLEGVQGVKGDKGDTGAGSNIIVKDTGVTIDSSPVDTLNFVGFNVDSSVGGVATLSLPSTQSIFGANYLYVSDEADSSTTSSSWQEKLTLSTGTIDSGVYRIGWSYEWAYSNGWDDFLAQILIDNSIVILNQRDRPKNSAPTTYTPSSGFYHFTNSSNSSHTISLYYKSNYAGNTARMSKARIEFWRVA